MVLILFVLFVIVSICFGTDTKRYMKVFYCLVSCFLILVAGFRPEGIDRDYLSYLEHFYNYQDYLLLEPSFKLISYCIYNIMGDSPILLFLIYAILGVSLKMIAIKQLSTLVWGGVLVYLSYYFLLHEMTQIRAGVASGFLLLSIKPLYDKRLKLFLLYAGCATIFHYSGIIIFLLWFFKNGINKNFLAGMIPLAIMVYIIGGTGFVYNLPIPILGNKLMIYQNLKDTDSFHNEINVFNAVYIVKLILFYLFWWKYKLLKAHSQYFPLLFTIYGFSLCLIPLLSDIPVLAYRLSELLGIVEIVLFPLICYLFKPDVISRFILFVYCFSMFSISIFYNRLISTEL